LGEELPRLRAEIKLRREGVVAPLVTLLRETTENVAIGLWAAREYSPGGVHLSPDYIPFTFSEPDLKDPPEDEIRRRRQGFEAWVLKRGFEECSKAVFESLHEAYLFVRFAQADLSAVATLDDLQKFEREVRRKAGKMQFPGFLQAIKSGLTSPLDLEDEISSVNRVRNCLEHRRGIVGESDVTPDEYALVLKWRELQLVSEKDGKVSAYKMGTLAPEGAAIGLRTVSSSRGFGVGERITLTAAEFNHVAYTCYLFGYTLANSLAGPPEDSIGASAPA